ncbi:MAG: hypothetical protein MR911_02885 [Spirochaetia bacterium]|nr:hypothetical protein [Spirochaetia bacterium]
MAVNKDWGLQVQMVDMSMKNAIKAGMDIIDILEKNGGTGQVVVNPQDKLFGPDKVNEIRGSNKKEIQDKRGK